MKIEMYGKIEKNENLASILIFEEISGGGLLDVSIAEILEILQKSKKESPIKAIRKFIKKREGIDLSPQTMGKLGEIYKKYIFERNVKILRSRIFDWEAGEFSDYNSCYWGGKKMAKKILLENGGGVFKIFSEMGKSRCWYYPISENTLILFNLYSSEGIRLEDIARILVENNPTFVGFKKVSFFVQNDISKLLYINEQEGILISSSPAFLEMDEIKISPKYYCDRCGNLIDWGNYDYTDTEIFCTNCEKIITCEICDLEIYPEEIIWLGGIPYCKNCFTSNFSRCDNCLNFFRNEDIIFLDENKKVCENCFKDYSSCSSCGFYFHEEELKQAGSLYFCENCLQKYTFACSACGEYNFIKNMTIIKNKFFCEDCAKKNF